MRPAAAGAAERPEGEASAVRFQLLGPLALTDGPDTVVLQPSKPANLLAALLLQANSTVSAEYLQRAVWGEEQPATARAALQTCVLRLRRLFTKHGVTSTSIEAVPGGYRITAEPRTLDLLGFRDRTRRAAGLDREPEAELRALQDALALWQGPPLTNVRSDVLHRDEVPRLAEERLRAVERVCDLLLALGRCGEVLADLWTATRVHPGHERFHEQLIEALYRTGRQAQALAEYRRVKGFLREELGVDPSPSLRRLELAILRGEELGPAGAGNPRVIRGETAPRALTAPAGPPAAPAPAPADGPGAGPVPAVPHFSGRAAEAAALAARLTATPPQGPEDHRPLAAVVSGAPGIGKSALAGHVARLVRDSFPAGQLLVPMTRPDGEPRPAGEVAAEVAAALGAAAGGRALLILDDVVDADQVRPLLAPAAGPAAPTGLRAGAPAGAPGGPAAARADDGAAPAGGPHLTVVVTSRMGLGGLIATHGGWVLRLSAFTEDESHALLLAALGAERVEAEPGAARRLAAACGHFPAALRILTARLLTRPGLRLADAVAWLGTDPLARLTLTDSPDHSVTGLFDRALARLDPRLSEAFTRLAQGPPELLADTGDPGPPGPGGGDPAAGGPRGPGPGAGAVPVPVPEAVREQLADAGLLEDGPPGPYRIHDLLRAHVRRTARIRDRRTEKV